MVVSDTVSVYVAMIQMALPFTFIFWGGEMIVTTFLRTAFGGKLSFKVYSCPEGLNNRPYGP